MNETLKIAAERRKSIRAIEASLQLVGFGSLLSIDIAPLRVWLRPLYVRTKNRFPNDGGFHFFAGPLHVWSMSRDRWSFGLEIEFRRNRSWWEKPNPALGQ